jgi:hypothetical protein
VPITPLLIKGSLAELLSQISKLKKQIIFWKDLFIKTTYFGEIIATAWSNEKGRLGDIVFI